jgi:hypothetical protein
MTVPSTLSARLERDRLNRDIECRLRLDLHLPVACYSLDLEYRVGRIAERRAAKKDRARSGSHRH